MTETTKLIDVNDRLWDVPKSWAKPILDLVAHPGVTRILVRVDAAQLERDPTSDSYEFDVVGQQTPHIKGNTVDLVIGDDRRVRALIPAPIARELFESIGQTIHREQDGSVVAVTLKASTDHGYVVECEFEDGQRAEAFRTAPPQGWSVG